MNFAENLIQSWTVFSSVIAETPVRVKKQVVEKYLDGERLKEEKALLETEMVGFLKYYRDNIITRIESRIANLNGLLVGRAFSLSVDRIAIIYFFSSFFYFSLVITLFFYHIISLDLSNTNPSDESAEAASPVCNLPVRC